MQRGRVSDEFIWVRGVTAYPAELASAASVRGGCSLPAHHPHVLDVTHTCAVSSPPLVPSVAFTSEENPYTTVLGEPDTGSIRAEIEQGLRDGRPPPCGLKPHGVSYPPGPPLISSRTPRSQTTYQVHALVGGPRAGGPPGVEGVPRWSVTLVCWENPVDSNK